MSDYDAVLLVSFGGPEAPEEVMPFLEKVTQGRGIPRERLAEVGEHYFRFGGVSPINGQNRALVDSVRGEMARRGVDLPLYWGNRNWDPLLPDVLTRMRDDGVRRALAFVTAAYSSYSGCRQYRENLAAARAAVGEDAPELDKVRHYFDHPGFVEPFVSATLAALQRLPVHVRAEAELVFTTHSIPLAAADASGPHGGAYVAQHQAAAALVSERVAAATGVSRPFTLVFQSRSGPPAQPWLEPDVSDHLEELVAQGVPGAVLVPIGFISDHMEVVYDLDTEAVETADRIGLPLARAATPGTDPRFVSMVVDLVEERLRDTPAADRIALSELGPWPDVCAAGCCANPRGAAPAVAGSD